MKEKIIHDQVNHKMSYRLFVRSKLAYFKSYYSTIHMKSHEKTQKILIPRVFIYFIFSLIIILTVCQIAENTIYTLG